ncbi:MAG: hypothetical protein L0332_07040 [Chloroflexi bacterium]|nr:hypothetical protein [Chloroflexota bacterium]MCI0579173.1 hypothetical protein [Chloroflexota bacterium]MCI0647954.1 hypothetical protein [Chloroflexota bacterium]MCI0726464.1 hypothetical protein [Chloroflexota bacterium]
MPFSITGFVIGQIVAQREGLDAQRASQLALLPGLLGVSAPSFLIIQQLARREAVATIVPPTGGTVPPATIPDTACLEAQNAALEAASAAREAATSARAAMAAADQAHKVANRVLRVARDTRTVARASLEELRTHNAQTQVADHDNAHSLEEILDLLKKAVVATQAHPDKMKDVDGSPSFVPHP